MLYSFHLGMSPQEGICLNFNKHVLLPRGFGRSSRNLHEEIFRTRALTQGFIFSLGTLLFVCLGTWYTKGVVTCSTFHTARRRNMTGMQPMEGNKWRKITRKQHVFRYFPPFSANKVGHSSSLMLENVRILPPKLSQQEWNNVKNPKMLTMLSLYCI